MIVSVTVVVSVTVAIPLLPTLTGTIVKAGVTTLVAAGGATVGAGAATGAVLGACGIACAEELEMGAALKVVRGVGLTVAGSVKAIETITGVVGVASCIVVEVRGATIGITVVGWSTEAGVGAASGVEEATMIVVLRVLVSSIWVIEGTWLASEVSIVGSGSEKIVVEVGPSKPFVDVVRITTRDCDDAASADVVSTPGALITVGMEVAKLSRPRVVETTVVLDGSMNCVPRVNDLDATDPMTVASEVSIGTVEEPERLEAVPDALVVT